MIQQQLHYFLMSIECSFMKCTSVVDIHLVRVDPWLLICEKVLHHIVVALNHSLSYLERSLAEREVIVRIFVLRISSILNVLCYFVHISLETSLKEVFATNEHNSLQFLNLHVCFLLCCYFGLPDLVQDHFLVDMHEPEMLDQVVREIHLLRNHDDSEVIFDLEALLCVLSDHIKRLVHEDGDRVKQLAREVLSMCEGSNIDLAEAHIEDQPLALTKRLYECL